MRAIVLTGLPWIAARLVRALGPLGVDVASIVAPRGGAFDWTDVLESGPRLTFVRQRDALEAVLDTVQPDALFCWCYPWRLPATALAMPALGCVNLHPSALPRHRGPAPLAWALRRGDTQIGVTWHRMVLRYDAGAILARGAFGFGDEDCDIMQFGPLVDRVGEALLPEVVSKLRAREPGEEQPASEVTYAPGFQVDDYATIDWSASARSIHNQVRAWALTGVAARLRAPLASVNGRTVRVIRTSLTEPEAPSIQLPTGSGWIWLTQVEDANLASEVQGPEQGPAH